MARILIVDDQEMILKTLETLLSSRGHIVTACLDAFDAIEKLANQPFELMITDAIMPSGINGFELIKTVRKNPKTKDLAVILLTGKREKKDVQRGIEAGADDYIVKPVDPDVLLEKVDSLLAVKGKDGNSAFQVVPTSEEAKFILDLKIVGVSEVGMTLHSSQPMQPNCKIKIASTFFDKVGMDVPLLRITACTANPSAGFVINSQFVGITELSLQPLRVWMRSRSAKAAG